MNKVANKQTIRNMLLQESEYDQDIVVLCSDSHGSGSMTPFAEQWLKQFIETGIAEQNLVAISTGLAKRSKKSFVVSPARFLSTRSMEQAKVDVAYNHANVKLIGISSGVSCGALGLTHHSTNDIVATALVMNMRVYLLSDRLQTECLIRALPKDGEPTHIRVGRNTVGDIYREGKVPFTLNKAALLRDGADVTIIACGEMVSVTRRAGELLEQKDVSARVLNMYCLEPIDREAVLKAAGETWGIVTIEKHAAFGELGSMVSQIVCAEHPARVKGLTLPDGPVIAGKSQQVFDYYDLNAEGIARAVMELI